MQSKMPPYIRAEQLKFHAFLSGYKEWQEKESYLFLRKNLR